MTISKAEKARRAAAAAVNKAPPASSEEQTITAPAVKETKGTGGVTETGRTVFVVCKMPRGMFLQLHQPVEQRVRRGGGIIETEVSQMRVGKQFRLKPTVLPFGAIPNYPIECGFSITRDVPAQFWRDYAEQNKNLQMLVDGLVRGFDTEADAIAYCREFEKMKHGLEPLAHENDPRVEKSFNPNVTDIEMDTDSYKKKAS